MPTEDVPMASQFDPDRPISDAVRSPHTKPDGGARILSLLLQAVVMAIALTLFFLFAGVATLLLMHLFVVGSAIRLRRRRRLRRSYPNFYRLRPVDYDPVVGLSLEDLRSLPWFHYSSDQTAAAATASDCAVCLDGFRDGDRCRNLPPCGHLFHRGCVDRWLMRSPACPMCRREVLTVSG